MCVTLFNGSLDFWSRFSVGSLVGLCLELGWEEWTKVRVSEQWELDIVVLKQGLRSQNSTFYEVVPIYLPLH